MLFALLIFRLVVAGMVTILVPYSILSSYPEHGLPLPYAVAMSGGLVMGALGAALYVRCVWDFAFGGQGMAPQVLVARGAYALVRNPMYAGLVTILLGEALWFRSWRLLGFAGAFWICLHLLVTLYEEPALAKQFGESYRRYREAVWRWIPRVRTPIPP